MRLSELRAIEGGKLPAYAWPGGYPVLYLDRDGCVLCPDCANAQPRDDSSSAVTDWFIHYEGSSMICDECGATVDSAYGEYIGEIEGK